MAIGGAYGFATIGAISARLFSQADLIATLYIDSEAFIYLFMYLFNSEQSTCKYKIKLKIDSSSTTITGYRNITYVTPQYKHKNIE